LINDKQHWHDTLRNKRIAYGVSQNKLAVAGGISRQYLNEMENGKAIPSKKLKESLDLSLERFNPDCPLEMLFDYVRIRFPTQDIKHIIESVLRLNMDYMIHEDFGFYGYSEHYRFGDVFILLSPDETKGVLLELKGQGCRQFENFLLAQGRTWYDFFRLCNKEHGVYKRIDLAINDKNGILSIPELTEKCKQEECISVFRTFKNYRSGELVHRDEKPDMGNTLYVGSLKSEIYFCIYEKDYEQYVKNGIALEDADIKNRFEIRLKNERACFAVTDLIDYGDADKTAFSIVNRYLRFVDREDKKRRSDWKLNKRWEWFIGKNRRKLKLTTQPEPYSLVRTLNWLHRQVAPTLKMALTLDNIRDTTHIQDMVENAKLSDRHETLLAQQALDVSDVIL
jgi:Putative phage replication protein RstA